MKNSRASVSQSNVTAVEILEMLLIKYKNIAPSFIMTIFLKKKKKT